MSEKSKSDVIMRVEGLSKSFSEGKLSVDVFSDVTFQVHQSEMIGIIGSSGAGKSSLLHLLGGLDMPTSGQVFIEGTDIHSVSEKQKGQLRNKLLGFIYQFHHLLPEFTALENVCMPLLIRGVKAHHASQQATEYITKVGLGKRIKHRIGELSGGERQRIAIARALVVDPKCVLADEPTGNLDFHTAQEVFELMLKLNQDLGTSFIIVTHNQELASKMDRVLLLENGQLQQRV